MKDKLMIPIIGVLSVVVPLLVAILLFMPDTGKFTDLEVGFLPQLNAVLNSATAVLLILGLIFIKNGNRNWHKMSMYSAFVLSSLFLISYVIYHASAEHTKFGGDGVVKYVYLALLLTHILLSIAIVPLVLFSIYFAITKRYERHKKLVKYTWPIWIYVAVSGVIVYLMISPYY